jgi:hypothetical protein
MRKSPLMGSARGLRNFREVYTKDPKGELTKRGSLPSPGPHAVKLSANLRTVHDNVKVRLKQVFELHQGPRSCKTQTPSACDTLTVINRHSCQIDKLQRPTLSASPGCVLRYARSNTYMSTALSSILELTLDRPKSRKDCRTRNHTNTTAC